MATTVVGVKPSGDTGSDGAGAGGSGGEGGTSVIDMKLTIGFWKDNLLCQLKKRNTLTRAFDILIKNNRQLQQNFLAVRAERNALQITNTMLRATLNEVEEKLKAVPANGTGRQADIGGGATIQDELTLCYIQLSNTTKHCLELTEANVKLVERLREETNEKDRYINDIREKEEEIDKLELILDNKEKAMDLLKEELTASLELLVKTEENAHALKKDVRQAQRAVEALETKYILKVSENAEILNNVNDQILKGERRRSIGVMDPPLSLTSLSESTTSFQKVSFLDLPVYGSTVVPKSARRQFQAHSEEINSIIFSPSGNSLVSGSTEKTIKVWDSYGFQNKAELTIPEEAVTSLSFSHNEEYLLTTCSSKAAFVWSLTTKTLRSLRGHQSKVTCGHFTLTQEKVVTGSHDRTIKVWDIQSHVCVRTILTPSSINDLCLTKDGTVITAHTDCSVRFWDLKSGNLIDNLNRIHIRPPSYIALSPDGSYVLTSSRDSTLKLINSTSREVESTIRHEKYSNNLKSRPCWSPDARLVVCGAENGDVYVWDKETKICESILKRMHSSAVLQCAWNPNGMYLATADKGGYITLWG